MIADGWRGEGTVLFGGRRIVGTAILRPSVRLREQLRTRPPRSFVRLSTVLLCDETPASETSPIAPCRNRYLLSQYLGEQAAGFFQNCFPVRTARLMKQFTWERTARATPDVLGEEAQL